MSFGKLLDHLEKLNGFNAVARLGSFQQAAKSLGVSQPTLSHSIKVLEEILETQLFIRKSRGVSLTPSGERLFAFATEMIHKVEDAEQRVRFPDEEMTGSLILGTYETMAIRYIPHVLKDLGAKYPRLTIKLKTSRSLSLIDDVNKGLVDIALLSQPFFPTGTISQTLFNDQYGFFASATHSQSEFTFDYWKQFPLITVPNAMDRTGRTIDQYLMENKVNFPIRYELDSFEVAKELTLQGIGLGVFPLKNAEYDYRIGSLVLLSERWSRPFGDHDISVVTARPAQGDQRINAVIDSLQESLGH